MEKPEKPPTKQDKPDEPHGRPPGQFVSNDLEEQTARFIAEVKDLAQRRREIAAKERRGPPPQTGGSQRSSRR
ncbi:MAG: hypothetical protein ACRDNH_11145 [Gaiellaceae bacterium]